MSKLKVQNPISEKNYALHRYECKDSRCNLCALWIREYPSFIPLNGYNSKIRCYISFHNINVLYFLSCTSFNGNTIYNGKTVNFSKF